MYVVDLSLEGWKKILEINIPELHDQMIVVTHLTTYSKAIITNDDIICE
ncbi:MAG: hypothetical protein ACE5KT_03205 [Methanosarcinales archaeon]